MRSKSTMFAVAICIAQAPMLLAQIGAGPGGTNKSAAPDTTVSGTVENVSQTAGKHHCRTHLILKTEQGLYDVHIGPTAFISSHNFAFTKGDQVEVVGKTKASANGKEVLIARQITKGANTLTLVNAQGTPEWSGEGPCATK